MSSYLLVSGWHTGPHPSDFDRGIARSELSGEDTQHTLGAPTTPAAAEPGPAAPPLPHSSPSIRGQDSVTRHIPVSALHHGKESVHKAKHIDIIRGSFQTSFGLFLLCFFCFFFFSSSSTLVTEYGWLGWSTQHTQTTNVYLYRLICGTVQDLLWKTNSEQNQRTEVRNRFPVSQETSKKEKGYNGIFKISH